MHSYPCEQLAISLYVYWSLYIFRYPSTKIIGFDNREKFPTLMKMGIRAPFVLVKEDGMPECQ
jgi:hypothetical protein